MWGVQLLQTAAALLAGAGAVTGTSSGTQAAQTGTAAGDVEVMGDAIASQAAQTGAAAGDVEVMGDAIASQAAQTGTASGSFGGGVSGTSSGSQAAQTGTAAGDVEVMGDAAGSQSVQTGTASGIHYAITTLDGDFAGANPNMSLSTITNAGTSTPTITIRVRSPDDAEWQQWLFKLNGVANKTLTIEILLTEKEDDPNAYLGTWVGPRWSADNTAGPSGWTTEGWSQVSGDRVTFDITPGANSSIYVASMPPWNQDTVLAWIEGLEAAHPTLIHDDLPSRVALGDAAYTCARSGTGTDENGRTITNLKLLGFRVGNDSLGTSPKRRIVLFSGLHSSEWNGGLQLRGFLTEWLTGTHATFLQTNFDLYVYPLHSVKGNYLGFRRNEAAASYGNHIDANREWTDGDTTCATVVQWQAIMDADHGVNHGLKVTGFFDFHDGKNVSDLAWFYYFDTQTDHTAYAALVDAENGDIIEKESTVSDGTTGHYWHEDKGLSFAWTCELADEKSTDAEVLAFGAAYARSVKTAEEADMLNLQFTGTSTGSQAAQTGTATGTVGAAFYGTASGSQAAQTGTADGNVALPDVTGTSAGSQAAQTGAASGNVALPDVTGTSAGSQVAQTGSAVGDVEAMGSAVGVQAAQTGTASGFFVGAGDVIGSSSGSQSAQTGTAAGETTFTPNFFSGADDDEELIRRPPPAPTAVIGESTGAQSAQGGDAAGQVKQPVAKAEVIDLVARREAVRATSTGMQGAQTGAVVADFWDTELAEAAQVAAALVG